ncbi:hypothetical protein C0991_005028 [Blastosporella zonata]|nr:hypothetical protein C0991_005028 [Blastosporella zonata]
MQPCEPKQENGIVEYSAGRNVTLTPAGKKAIADARQSLSAVVDTSPSAAPEDLVGKPITQTTSTVRGAKRGRFSTRIARDEEGYDTDDAFPSPRGTRPKRPRVSAAIPFSLRAQVTKLKAELQALQKEKENGLWLRESSPLTDLDEEEEAARLRNELKHKEEELERIRLELAKASGIPVMNQPYRLSTPTIRTRPSSPTRPGSGIHTHPRPVDLLRTQSGSCISLLSRQPTPPRSPGAASDDFAEVMGTDQGGFVMQGEDHDMQDQSSQTQIAIGTATAAITDLKVIELERDLASRVAEIQNLEAQLAQLQVNVDEAQQALLERNQRLSALSASFSNLQLAASQKELDLKQQVEGFKIGFESSQSSHLAGLKQDIQERNATIKNLTEERKDILVKLNSVQESLSAADRERTALASASEMQAERLRSEVEQRDAAQAELHVQRSINTELDAKIEVMLARISALDDEVHSLQESKDSLNSSLLEVRTEQALVSEKLRETEASNESLLGQLTVATNDKCELQEALQISEHNVATLNSRILALGNSVSQGQAKINHLNQSLDTAEHDKATLRQHVVTAELTVSTLQSELIIAKDNVVDEVTGKLAGILEERAELLVELEKGRATISASAASMNELKDRLATTTDSLVNAKSVAAELQRDLIATDDKLKLQEEVNAELTQAGERKEAKLAQLNQGLRAAESMVENCRAETMASDASAQELRSRLSNMENELKEVRDSFSSAKAMHVLESKKKAAEMSDLEARMQGVTSEIDELQSQLLTGFSEKAELRCQIDEQGMELGEIKAKIAAEFRRAVRLEEDLVGATGKLQEAEEELAELRASKAADEATIENLKGMFSTHVEKQTHSLAVLNSQVISAQSSPAPPKRRSARATGKVIPIQF